MRRKELHTGQSGKIDMVFFLNGREVRLSVDPIRPLIDVLRRDLRLTGTKEGCGKGECGACTVIIDGQTADSCLVPISQVEGRHVLTIEGLGTPDHPHPIQAAFVEEGAVQCGFCIPGMVLSAKALLDRNSAPTPDDIREGLSGNLCRCTGYSKIFAAVRRAARKLKKRRK